MPIRSRWPRASRADAETAGHPLVARSHARSCLPSQPRSACRASRAMDRKHGTPDEPENAFPLGRQRLEQLEGFKKITAPFAGTITARHVDVGTLVSSGSGRSLRPFEQESLHAFSYRSIRCGISRAAVRTAGALDPASRTLLTELEFRITTVRCLPECTHKLSSPCGKKSADHHS